MKKLLLTISILLLVPVLMACGGSNDSNLVGVWEREVYQDEELWFTSLLILNADGTGESHTIIDEFEVPTLEFEWSTSGGEFTQEFTARDDADFSPTPLAYVVEGDTLTITEGANDFVYTRVE